MNICVAYRHTFACDLFENVASFEEAKEKAIERLKAEFPNMKFPTFATEKWGTSSNDVIEETRTVINCYEDLIEEIFEDEEEEED